MPLEHITDDDKLAAEGVVRPLVIRGGEAGRLQVRPTMAHLGVMWGQAIEAGLSLEAATDMITGIAENWADGGNARPVEVSHIGDDDILDGVNVPAVLRIIPDSDWGGLFDFGCQYGQRRQIGQSHVQALYETGEWLRRWYRQANGEPVENPWPPPQRPVHPDPLFGQVAIHDGAWVDATGPRNMAGLHVGNLIGHGLTHGLASILPYLDLAADLGYHELRSWFQLKTSPGGWWDRWTTQRWNPADDRVAFAEILAAAADRGLRWHLAGGGIKDMSNGEEDAAFGALNWAIGQVGPQAISLVEGCNEIRDTGDVDDIDPAELTRLVRIATAGYPQILTALSAYTGTEDRDILRRYTPSWMQFYLVHGSRDGRLHDKLRHMYSLAGEGTPVRRNMKQSESYGPGRLVSAIGNSHELNAHAMVLSAAQCALARGQWTFMSGPGVVLESEDLASMPGLRETPAILRALPQDLARFQLLGHGGDRFRGERIFAALDDWRADHAIHHDGRFVTHLYGPPEQHSPDDLRRERDVRDMTILADGPEGRVITGRLG